MEFLLAVILLFSRENNIDFIFVQQYSDCDLLENQHIKKFRYVIYWVNRSKLEGQNDAMTIKKKSSYGYVMKERKYMPLGFTRKIFGTLLFARLNSPQFTLSRK